MPSTSNLSWIKTEPTQDSGSFKTKTTVRKPSHETQVVANTVRPMKLKITNVKKTRAPNFHFNFKQNKMLGEYSENMEKAVKAVTVGSKSLRKTARFYNIPYTSLWCRVQKEKKNLVGLAITGK